MKRILAFIMAIAVGMISCIPSNMVKAEGASTNNILQSARVMNFGTEGFIDPERATSASSEWLGSYVYFGVYDGIPVKYRVLDKDSTDFGGTTILLDCDAVIWDRTSSSGQNSRFDSSSKVWAESELKYYLNSENEYSSTGFLTTSFIIIAAKEAHRKLKPQAMLLVKLESPPRKTIKPKDRA